MLATDSKVCSRESLFRRQSSEETGEQKVA